MAPSSRVRIQARIGPYTRSTPRSQGSESSTQPRENSSITTPAHDVPTEEEIDHTQGGIFNIPQEARSELEAFNRRQVQRHDRRGENLSDLLADVDDVESIPEHELHNFINEVTADQLEDYGLPTLPQTPARRSSHVSNYVRLLSLTTMSNNDDEDSLSDIEADLADLVSIDDDHDDERDQIFNSLNEAQRLAEDSNHIPIAINEIGIPDLETGSTRAALSQIQQISQILRNATNRRTQEGVPSHLQANFLRCAMGLDRPHRR